MTLKQRIEDVETRVAAACERAGRPKDSVGIVAVTKYVSLQTAEETVSHGYVHLGENRWQDAKEKVEAIGDRAVWHFIGTLQTNKVKDVVGRFRYIHSLDRISLAREVDKKARALGIVVPCFIQVNVSGEESKQGLPPEELHSFAERLNTLPGIEPVGLMTMAPFDMEAEAARPVFRGLRQIKDELNAKAVLAKPLMELSMGMSGDFEVAVEEGATWIRLGTVLVGKE